MILNSPKVFHVFSFFLFLITTVFLIFNNDINDDLLTNVVKNGFKSMVGNYAPEIKIQILTDDSGLKLSHKIDKEKSHQYIFNPLYDPEDFFDLRKIDDFIKGDNTELRIKAKKYQIYKKIKDMEYSVTRIVGSYVEDYIDHQAYEIENLQTYYDDKQIDLVIKAASNVIYIVDKGEFLPVELYNDFLKKLITYNYFILGNKLLKGDKSFLIRGFFIEEGYIKEYLERLAQELVCIPDQNNTEDNCVDVHLIQEYFLGSPRSILSKYKRKINNIGFISIIESMFLQVIEDIFLKKGRFNERYDDESLLMPDRFYLKRDDILSIIYDLLKEYTKCNSIENGERRFMNPAKCKIEACGKNEFKNLMVTFICLKIQLVLNDNLEILTENN